MSSQADNAAISPLDVGKRRQETFDAICLVWDQAVAALYPKQEPLRQALSDLQRYLALETRPK